MKKKPILLGISASLALLALDALAYDISDSYSVNKDVVVSAEVDQQISNTLSKRNIKDATAGLFNRLNSKIEEDGVLLEEKSFVVEVDKMDVGLHLTNTESQAIYGDDSRSHAKEHYNEWEEMDATDVCVDDASTLTKGVPCPLGGGEFDNPASCFGSFPMQDCGAKSFLPYHRRGHRYITYDVNGDKTVIESSSGWDENWFADVDIKTEGIGVPTPPAPPITKTWAEHQADWPAIGWVTYQGRRSYAGETREPVRSGRSSGCPTPIAPVEPDSNCCNEF